MQILILSLRLLSGLVWGLVRDLTLALHPDFAPVKVNYLGNSFFVYFFLYFYYFSAVWSGFLLELAIKGLAFLKAHLAEHA